MTSSVCVPNLDHSGAYTMQLPPIDHSSHSHSMQIRTINEFNDHSPLISPSVWHYRKKGSIVVCGRSLKL